jgi:hypothetical protein
LVCKHVVEVDCCDEVHDSLRNEDVEAARYWQDAVVVCVLVGVDWLQKLLGIIEVLTVSASDNTRMSGSRVQSDTRAPSRALIYSIKNATRTARALQL